ncbi:MAG: glycosyltransferase [Elusimicrobia bacterium]|nr:glycosyltransferase [Elusimicrobiota bacterium]
MERRAAVALLTPRPPYPWDGGSKRILTLARLNKGRFRFVLLTFRPEVRSPAEAAADLRDEREHLAPVFDRVVWVEPPSGPGQASVDGFGLPRDARRFYSPAMDLALADTVREESCRLVHVEYDLMAVYGRKRLGVPSLLTQHDAGGLSLTCSYFRESAGWRGLLAAPDWLRRINLMRRAGAWFDRVVVTTEEDRRDLSRLVIGERLRTVPTGVDLSHFRPDARRGPEGDLLVFVGHYPHFPNEDAVVRFADRILPRILSRRPGVRVLVVGSRPTEAVLAAARRHPELEVTGAVPDVRPVLARASVFIAPIRLGRGIKGKVLEAFAMGLPVVASSRAAAGIDAAEGRDLLVARTDSGFADEVVRLLESPALRSAVGEAGRARASALYDWGPCSQRLSEVYDELIG